MDIAIVLSQFLSLYVVVALCSEHCVDLAARQISSYVNMKIHQSRIWTRFNLTRGECMIECKNEKYCVSFHFCPLGQVCIALRERFDCVIVTAYAAPGFQLYQTSKALSVPGSDCELDVDCVSMPNSHCNNGKCRCDIGYGIDGTNCRILTETEILCAERGECINFSDVFTVYVGYLVWGNAIGHSTDMTLASCQQMCLDNPDCELADFSTDTNDCWIDGTTWYDVSSADHGTNSEEFSLSQRECNWVALPDDEMKLVYGDDSPSCDTVVRWKRNFQIGHTSLTDEPRCGRPSLTDDTV